MMLTGNYACAYGVKLCRAEVIPVYPITPQTHIMEKLADFVASSKQKSVVPEGKIDEVLERLLKEHP